MVGSKHKRLHDKRFVESLLETVNRQADDNEIDLEIADDESRQADDSLTVYLNVCLRYYSDVDDCKAYLDTQLALTAADDDAYAVLASATSKLGDQELYRHLLRQRLASILANQKSDSSQLLSIYLGLLSTTDRTRELKVYLMQLSGLIEMRSQSNSSLIEQYRPLIVELARLKRDYQSLSDTIAQVAKRIRQVSPASEQTGDVQRLLEFIDGDGHIN